MSPYLAVPPDGAGHGVEGRGPGEAGGGPAQPLPRHGEAEAAGVHVQNHRHRVGHRPVGERIVIRSYSQWSNAFTKRVQ